MIKKDAEKIYRRSRKIGKELKKIGKIVFKMTKRGIKNGIKMIGNKCLDTAENFKKYASLDSTNYEIGEFLKLYTILGLPLYECMVFSGLMECTTIFSKITTFALMPATIWGIYKCMEARYNEKIGSTPTIDTESHDLPAIEEQGSLAINQQLSREKTSASIVAEEQCTDFSKAFEEVPAQELTTAFEEVPSQNLGEAFEEMPSKELQVAFMESEPLDLSRAFMSDEQAVEQNNTMSLVRRNKNQTDHE